MHKSHMFATGRAGKAYIVSTVVLVLFLCLSIYLGSPIQLFSRVVGRPAPKSLQNLRVEGHDWFGLKPEPVVRMAFSASAEDLEKLLVSQGAKPLIGDAIGSGAPGPSWWPLPTRLGTMRGFSLKGGDPRFVWIDATGTNAFYLLFGV